MTIATLHRVFSRTVLILGFTALVACGGGGGEGDNTTASRSSNSTAGTSSAGISSSVGVSSIAPSSSSVSSVPLPDTIPNSFSFNSVTGVELSAVTPSDAVTISGINTLATVSVTGGEYSIDGAAFTAMDGQVSNGQTLAVRLTASAVHSTTSSATVTVGGVSASFSVTTKADTTPEAFSFEPVIDAALDTVYTSNVITITGIDAAVPITVTGGEYAINSEETFTSAAGTVSANNTVRLRGTSATGNNLTQAVVVTIGGVSATYSITTIPDTTPPVAEFKFPTPYTMSEADTVKVRGTATDDNTITSVKVVVRSFKLDTPDQTIASTEFEVTPKAEIDGVKDFSSWTADIPLTALAENEIKVIATDENDNTIANEDANKVTIRQADVASAFPDEVNEFSFIESSTVNNRDGALKLLVTQSGELIEVDINTGQRSFFTNHQSSCNSSLARLLSDEVGGRIYGYCASRPRGLVELSADDGSFIAKHTSELFEDITYLGGLALDRNNGRSRLVLVENRWWFTNPDIGGQVIIFSMENKSYSILYSADHDPIVQDAEGIAVDGDRYLITVGGQNEDVLKHQVISVNALTGLHNVVSNNVVGDGESFSTILPTGDIAYLTSVVVDAKNNRMLVSEKPSNKLFAIDLSTNFRSIFKNIVYKETDEPNTLVDDIDQSSSGEYIILADNARYAILIIDSLTGEKMILSKSKNDF